MVFFGFLIWILLCFVVAGGAKKRGRSFGGYLILSIFLSPLIGLIIILVLGETESVKKEHYININLNTNNQGSSIGDSYNGRSLLTNYNSSLIAQSSNRPTNSYTSGSTRCQKCGKMNSGGYTTCPHCGSDALVNPSAYIEPTIVTKNVTPVITEDQVTEVEIISSSPDLETENDNSSIKLEMNYFIGKNWNDILIDNHLEEYIDIFEKNKLMDFSLISELNENDLEKLGIEIMGDRKKILKIINGIKNFIK